MASGREVQGQDGWVGNGRRTAIAVRAAVQGNVVLLWQGFWDLREVSFVYTQLFQFPQMIVDDVVSVRLFVCD